MMNLNKAKPLITAFILHCIAAVPLLVHAELVTGPPDSSACRALKKEAAGQSTEANAVAVPILLKVEAADKAAVDTAASWFKQALAANFSCMNEGEVLARIETLQKQAVQNHDPKAFLDAEKKYGWQGILRVSMSVDKKYNSFLGQHLLDISVAPKLTDLQGKVVSDFSFELKHTGDTATADVLRDELPKWNEYIGARIQRDYKLKK